MTDNNNQNNINSLYEQKLQEKEMRWMYTTFKSSTNNFLCLII